MTQPLFLQHNQNTLAYYDQGQGPCLIFLHGFLEDSSIWQDIADCFTSTHRVICVDYFGHGKSQILQDNLTLSDISDTLFHLIDYLSIQKATIIGHSMGGYLALAFSQHYGDYIEQLILINSSALPDSIQKKVQRNRAIKLVENNKNTFVQLAIANLFTPDKKQLLSQKIALLLQQAKNTPSIAIISALKAMQHREDHSKTLHTATFPIIFILGQNDPLMNFSTTIEQLDQTPVILYSLAQGHMLPIEAPEAVRTILRELV